jgi:CHRD domain-containing protein
MTRSVYALAIISLLAVSSPAAADSLTFIATGPTAPGLSPLNENPPHPESSGTGTALVTWDIVTNMMTVNVVFSGLTTPNTAAHIHCCVNPPGNTGVATTVPTFTGFPGGVTSGTYSHTFDMLQLASYNPAFVAAHGGTAASAAAALLAGIQAGQAYLNIHTQMFPGGEIRGFLAVPVDISIKPGATPPVRINRKSQGKIPVAILSTPTFDAVTSVDTSSVTFGRTGDEPSLAFCNAGGEDVNGDGLADLVCHFETQLAGFQSGDALGILKGTTVQGSPIIGQEAIVVVP